jgi:hypothetical protein
MCKTLTKFNQIKTDPFYAESLQHSLSSVTVLRSAFKKSQTDLTVKGLLEEFLYLNLSNTD